LLVDVGDNPDRPRPGRIWLRNVYHVHQRLCMAFPSQRQREYDPLFLRPYQPCAFSDARPTRCAIDLDVKAQVLPCAVLATEPAVDVPRDTDHNFLFRIDPKAGNRAVILVQSALQPDWDYAFQNADYLLAAPPSVPQPLPLSFEAGMRLRFRLLANPVRKVSERSVDGDGKPIGEKWIGKRVPVPATGEDLRHWLERRAEPGWSAPKNSEKQQFAPGFRLIEVFNVQPGYVYFNKTHEATKGQRLRSARFDGTLEVTDPGRFRDTLIRGIGSGKAFGFGLLSVAPAG
jgi:CRISPR system Cascade subunit CasE